MDVPLPFATARILGALAGLAAALPSPALADGGGADPRWPWLAGGMLLGAAGALFAAGAAGFLGRHPSRGPSAGSREGSPSPEPAGGGGSAAAPDPASELYRLSEDLGTLLPRMPNLPFRWALGMRSSFFTPPGPDGSVPDSFYLPLPSLGEGMPLRARCLRLPESGHLLIQGQRLEPDPASGGYCWADTTALLNTAQRLNGPWASAEALAGLGSLGITVLKYTVLFWLGGALVAGAVQALVDLERRQRAFRRRMVDRYRLSLEAAHLFLFPQPPLDGAMGDLYHDEAEAAVTWEWQQSAADAEGERRRATAHWEELLVDDEAQAAVDPATATVIPRRLLGEEEVARTLLRRFAVLRWGHRPVEVPFEIWEEAHVTPLYETLYQNFRRDHPEQALHGAVFNEWLERYFEARRQE